ncbi:MAG: biopolymer transporter ExbD [Zavarzinella sp.]
MAEQLWTIIPAGTTRQIRGLTFNAVLNGVREEQFDSADLIFRNGETPVSIDTHPEFEEAILDLQPVPRRPEDDETRLDMNPLIDVALVLLIFFMLTTVYEQIRKEFNPPPGQSTDAQGRKTTENKLKEFTIRVSITVEDGKPVFRIENDAVPQEKLLETLIALKQKTGNRQLALEVQPDVPWKAVVAINDAAAGAEFTEIIRVVRKVRRD